MSLTSPHQVCQISNVLGPLNGLGVSLNLPGSTFHFAIGVLELETYMLYMLYLAYMAAKDSHSGPRAFETSTYPHNARVPELQSRKRDLKSN